MMKKIFYALAVLGFLSGVAIAEEAAQDPHAIFYKANTLYEKRDYEKAAEEYAKILQKGVESGPVYYNLGNALFKTGKIGYAILAYKKAQALMPGDSDLKSNLSYAQTLTDDSALTPPAPNKVTWLIKIPFKDINLNSLAIILMTLYIILISITIGGIVNHLFRRRIAFVFYLVLISFIITLAGFGVRYYEEDVLKRGIVVVKTAEARYEPIDKSAAYYTLKEGQEVTVLKTRDDWRRIRRLDGKLGWVKSDAVEEID